MIWVHGLQISRAMHPDHDGTMILRAFYYFRVKLGKPERAHASR
jgi:hypothetical protein